MREEYGGYLTIEQNLQEYYHEGIYAGLLRFNAARYAIVYAAVTEGYKKVWIPYYLCRSVYDALRRYEISCGFYSVNRALEPELEHAGDGEAVLIVSYFGIKPQSFYQKMLERYSNIIFDNTQAFFAEPVIRKGIYNVYSPRKFAGVADGAYLISKSIKTEGFGFRIDMDESSRRVSHLFSAIEKGTNACYEDAKKAEEELADSPVKYMSRLTRTMLQGIDYCTVRKQRVRNFEIMDRAFAARNEIQEWNLGDGTDFIPMVYPLLLPDGGEIRKRLVSEKVYCPQWWKWILEDACCKAVNDTEIHFAKDLIPIMIDQRYREDEIKELAEIVKHAAGICRV